MEVPDGSVKKFLPKTNAHKRPISINSALNWLLVVVSFCLQEMCMSFSCLVLGV